jgi:hypothetical protein
MGDGHPFWCARGWFFCAFGSRTGDVKDGRGGTGAGCTDGAGFRVGGDEEAGVAATHLGVLVAVFSVRSACGWAMSRVGDMLRVPDGWMRPDFELEVMMRTYRWRAPIFACS